MGSIFPLYYLCIWCISLEIYADHLAMLGLLMCMQCLCDLRAFITGPLLVVCVHISYGVQHRSTHFADSVMITRTHSQCSVCCVCEAKSVP